MGVIYMLVQHKICPMIHPQAFGRNENFEMLKSVKEWIKLFFFIKLYTDKIAWFIGSLLLAIIFVNTSRL